MSLTGMDAHPHISSGLTLSASQTLTSTVASDTISSNVYSQIYSSAKHRYMWHTLANQDVQVFIPPWVLVIRKDSSRGCWTVFRLITQGYRSIRVLHILHIHRFTPCRFSNCNHNYANGCRILRCGTNHLLYIDSQPFRINHIGKSNLYGFIQECLNHGQLHKQFAQ